MNSNPTLHAPVVYTHKPQTGAAPHYNVSIGILRAFLVALVVAHHAVLAYFPWLPLPGNSLLAQPRLWEAFPTLDPQRWTGWAVFVGFNDTFFMALFFFVSGLFVWTSLQRKGARQFIGDRLLRLGLPFVLATIFLAPLAYYPAYLQTTTSPALAGFWRQWRALGNWPAGPVWFLWVLLAFGFGAVVAHKLIPHAAERVNNKFSFLWRRPFAAFIVLCLLSSLAYVPMAMAFNPLQWTAWGPFAFQTSRIIHYALYFAAGVVVGAGHGNLFLSSAGPLAKRWLFWPAIALVSFAVASAISTAAASNPVHARSLDIAGHLGFCVTCAACSFACLVIFLRFAKSRGPMWTSLCACSYGIYLVHYPIVNWLQHIMIPRNDSAFLKGVTVALLGFALSWLVAWMLRRVPVIARIL